MSTNNLIHENSDSLVTKLYHAKANVLVSKLPSGKYELKVHRLDPDFFVRWDVCETAYPLDLIKQIFEVKGPGWLCDEIARDESPHYTGAALRWQLLSYVGEEQFENARILDFGCGSGASTSSLSRMFPSAKIVGIELEQELLSIAKSRANYYKLKNVEFYHSENPEKVPDDIGQFDHIIMTGVFEHLLPEERLRLLPQLWSLLKPDGILFLHETPNRQFPIETHTTGGLPFINYLPKSVAQPYANKFSKRNLAEDNWETLLRKGMRGGSVSEIVGILKASKYAPSLMNPSKLGVKNRIDLWYLTSEKAQHRMAKKIAFTMIKFIKMTTGVELVPYLELAIQKK